MTPEERLRMSTHCPDTHCDYPPYSHKCVVHWDPQYAAHFRGWEAPPPLSLEDGPRESPCPS